MNRKEKLLIIDDDEVSRAVLQKMLSDRYSVLCAADGREAITFLLEQKGTVSVVLFSLREPCESGLEFLDRIKRISGISTIPVIAILDNKDEETELCVLRLGVCDCISRDCNLDILRQRVSNIIQICETAALKNAIENDTLTRIYNRETFFRKAKDMMRSAPERSYDIICVDVGHFKLINDLFGMDEGNRLLKYLAETISSAIDPLKGVCGRLMGDVFAICHLRGEGNTEVFVERLRQKIKGYDLDVRVHLNFGIYQVCDITAPVSLMCDRANLAIERVKECRGIDFSYYEPSYYRDFLKTYAATY